MAINSHFYINKKSHSFNELSLFMQIFIVQYYENSDGLLIRRSLVRAQVEEPNKRSLVEIQGFLLSSPS